MTHNSIPAPRHRWLGGLAWIIHGAEFVGASVGDCEQSPCEFMSQAAAPGRP